MRNRYTKNANGSFNITLVTGEMSRAEILESENVFQEYERQHQERGPDPDLDRMKKLGLVAQKNIAAVKANG